MRVKINENIFNVKTLVDENSQGIGMTGKKFDETFERNLAANNFRDSQGRSFIL
jgi:hypothetical protein